MIKIFRINKYEPKLGVITIASEIREDETGEHVYYGVSYQNPNDNYNKKLGIEMAVKRLNAQRFQMSFSGAIVLPKRKFTFDEIIMRICCDILINDEVPNFAIKYIKETIFTKI